MHVVSHTEIFTARHYRRCGHNEQTAGYPLDILLLSMPKLDNLIQIGHGVKIGKNCAFAAQVGIAGGANIGDGVILAGQVGVNNRVKVGNNVIASSKCGIHCDIEDGKVISGFPAMENKSWLRSSSIFKKLPELAKKLRQLDKQ